MSIKVCIGNYGYYAAGELRDTWIELPQKAADIERFLADNGLKDALHEEIYISDYDGPILGIAPSSMGPFCESTSLHELNLLAAYIDENPYNAETLEEILNCNVDCPDTVLGILSWMLDIDDLPYFTYDYEDAYTVDDFGQTCVERFSDEENMGRTIMSGTSLQSMLEREDKEIYFDYEMLGRSEEESGYVSLGERGYVDTTMNFPDEDAHDAKEIKEEICFEF